MANVNWKTLSLLIGALLIALGLQAGAIKIMINLARQADPPAVARAGTVSSKPAISPAAIDTVRHQPAKSEEQAVHEPAPTVHEPAPPTREPKPAVLVSDPPHLADLNPKPASIQNEPNPEAHPPLTPAPQAPAHPSAEAALVATSPKPSPVTNDGHADNPPVAVAPPAAPLAEANSVPQPADEAVLQEPAWLKARNPKHYTVQLYSGKDMETLKEIAAATTSSEPQAYYSTGSRSGPWYSLVAGDYSDYAAAQAAAAKLTADSPALKPWIRRFDEIQAKMR